MMALLSGSRVAATFVFTLAMLSKVGFTQDRDAINVKTILFKEIDTHRACWSPQDVRLLMVRKMMQDILPRKLPTNFENLAIYFKKCIETVKSNCSTENSQIAEMALFDTLGGYLKSVAIPILNEAYYAGNVDYATAAEIHGLYGMIMASLGTDGGGWSSPCDMRKIPTKVQALTMTMTNATEACECLEVKNNIQYVREGDKEPSKIPIPYLDDNFYPGSIAVPIKGNSLFSLMSNNSANLLPKYYILAMSCLASQAYTKKDILDFNHRFYEWIISSVVPHVHESERWYPGFGGVMRIIETMNQEGLAVEDVIKQNIESNNCTIPLEFLTIPSGKCLFQKYKTIITITFILLVILVCCCGGTIFLSKVCAKLNKKQAKRCPNRKPNPCKKSSSCKSRSTSSRRCKYDTDRYGGGSGTDPSSVDSSSSCR